MPINDNPARKPWTREELLLVLHLYYRIPFGKQHRNAPEVIELAQILQRTPSSVAMKLSNFTSLDPIEIARGVKGLDSVSQLDKSIWQEFSTSQAALLESEALWEQRHSAPEPSPVQPAHREISEILDINIPAFRGKSTETATVVKSRMAQSFFRRAVFKLYEGQCCISGLAIPTLLRASHILRWSDHPEHRTNPSNGLCLSAIHDAAFDTNLISLDENYRVCIGPTILNLNSQSAVQEYFIRYNNAPIQLPDKFLPNREFLAQHRKNLI